MSPGASAMSETNFRRTANWLAACGKQPQNPEHVSVQIGCHIEELTEFLLTLRISKSNHVHSSGGQLVIERSVTDLRWLAGKLKSGEYLAHVQSHMKVDALDALCDCEVTGNGVAFLMGYDKEGADQAVLASNDAKLIDGKPVLKPGGKIGKPEGWQPPNLTPFI